MRLKFIQNFGFVKKFHYYMDRFIEDIFNLMMLAEVEIANIISTYVIMSFLL